MIGGLLARGHWLLRRLPPERAHAAALRLARLAPANAVRILPALRTSLAGLELAHPVCLAAGFDKNAQAVAELARLGFAAIEIGTVTPKPQAGNPQPRLFRLEEDDAIINRMGFNNDGLAAIADRLASRRRVAGVIGANIGMNKDAADPVLDYLAGLERLAPLVDYVTVNVSSPNTPGLRALQQPDRLAALLRPLVTRRDQLAAAGLPRRPIFLKIAPDLAPADEAGIADVVTGLQLDALIVSNTTTARPPSLRSRHAAETGGLSGRPLMAPSTDLLRRLRRRLGPELPLIGVGGVMDAGDAWAKIRAGATAIQIYTGLVYGGPGLVRSIVEGLAERVRRAGLDDIRDAVGSDA